MFNGLFFAVQVVALLAATCLAISLEQFGQFIEAICFRAKVTHVILGHFDAHFSTIIAMEAVALDNGGTDFLASEYMFKGAFYSSGACTG